MAPASIMADDQGDYDFENTDWNKQVMRENDSPALFSTDEGRLAKRPSYASQPRQVRSDRHTDLLEMISRLREKFPALCMMLDREDLKKNTLVCDYFDNFDLRFYGPRFLFDVLSHIVQSNHSEKAATEKAERAADVDEYCHNWIEANPEAFELFEAEHQWSDLFLPEHVKEYGFPFLWDAFWRIAQIKDARDFGHIPLARTSEVSSSKMSYIPMDSETVSKPAPHRRLSLPQTQSQHLHSQRSPTSRTPQLYPPAPIDPNPPPRIRPTLQIAQPPYAPHFLYFQSPHMTSPNHGYFTTDLTGYPMMHQVPRSLIMPSQSNISQRFEMAGNNVLRSGDGHGASMVHRRRAISGDDQRVNGPHQLYGASGQTFSHYQDTNRQISPRKYSRTPIKQSQGARNPPKQDTDDVRYGNLPSSRERRSFKDPPFSRQAPSSNPRRFPNQRRSFSNFHQPSPYALETEIKDDAAIPRYGLNRGSQANVPATSIQFGAMTYPLQEHGSPESHSETQRQQTLRKRFDTHGSDNLAQKGEPSSKKRTASYTAETQLQQDIGTSLYKSRENQMTCEANTKPTEDLPCQMWVGGLPSDTSEQELLGLVSELHGFKEILSFRTANNINSAKKWAIIRFQSQEETDAAISQLSGQEKFKQHSLIAHRAQLNPQRHLPSSSNQKRLKDHKAVPTFIAKTEVLDESRPWSTRTNDVTAPLKPMVIPDEANNVGTKHEMGEAVTPEQTTRTNRVHQVAHKPLGRYELAPQITDKPPIEKASTEKLALETNIDRSANEEKTLQPQSVVDPSKATINQTPQMVENAATVLPKHVAGSTAEFPPLSESVKQGMRTAKETTVPKAEHTAKSFAQIASEARSYPKKESSTSVQMPDNIPSTSSGLQGSSNQDQPMRNTKTTRHSKEKAIIPGQEVDPPKDSSYALEDQIANATLSLHAVVQPTAQAMSREQNSSVDTIITSSPTEGTTGLTSLQLGSPERDSAYKDDYENSSDEVAGRPIALIDPTQLRHRLEEAVPTAAHEDVNDTNSLRGSTLGLLQNEVSILSDDLIQDVKSTGTKIQKSPPKTPTKKADSPQRPDKLDMSQEKTLPPPAPAAEAISTHKKKARPKSSVTPVKKAQPSASKGSKTQQTAENTNSAEVTSPKRTQYPNVTTDIVTVLASPARAPSGQSSPHEDAESHSVIAATEGHKSGDRDEQPIQDTRTAHLEYDRLPSLAQDISRGHSWPVILREQRVQEALRSSTLARTVSDLQEIRILPEVISHEDKRVRNHIQKALFTEYKLQKIATKQVSMKETADHALMVLEACPLRERKRFDDAISLKSIVQWIVDNEEWVSNIPEDIVFDSAMGADVVSQAEQLEIELHDFATKHLKIHFKGWLHPGRKESSIDLAQQARNLQRTSPRGDRMFIRGADAITEQMMWNITTLGYIDEKKAADLWPDETGLPPGLRHVYPDYDCNDMPQILSPEVLHRSRAPSPPFSIPASLVLNFEHSNDNEQSMASDISRSMRPAATTPLMYTDFQRHREFEQNLTPIDTFATNHEIQTLKLQIMRGHHEKSKQQQEQRNPLRILQIHDGNSKPDEDEPATKAVAKKKRKSKKKAKKGPKEQDVPASKPPSASGDETSPLTVKDQAQQGDEKSDEGKDETLRPAETIDIVPQFDPADHALKMNAIMEEHTKREAEKKEGTPYAEARLAKIVDYAQEAGISPEKRQQRVWNAIVADNRKDMGIVGVSPAEVADANRAINLIARSNSLAPDRLEDEEACPLPGPRRVFEPVKKKKDAWRVPSGEAVWGKSHGEKSGLIGNAAGKGGRKKA